MPRPKITIALIAAAFLASLITWILKSKDLQIAYHKKAYIRAEERLLGKQTFGERAEDAWRKALGMEPIIRSINMADPNNPEARRELHEKALLGLGYLEKREFCLTNKGVDDAVKILARVAPKELPKARLWQIGPSETKSNVVMIRAERHDMPKWEKLVREVDVPR